MMLIFFFLPKYVTHCNDYISGQEFFTYTKGR